MLTFSVSTISVGFRFKAQRVHAQCPINLYNYCRHIDNSYVASQSQNPKPTKKRLKVASAPKNHWAGEQSVALIYSWDNIISQASICFHFYCGSEWVYKCNNSQTGTTWQRNYVKWRWRVTRNFDRWQSSYTTSLKPEAWSRRTICRRAVKQSVGNRANFSAINKLYLLFNFTFLHQLSLLVSSDRVESPLVLYSLCLLFSSGWAQQLFMHLASSRLVGWLVVYSNVSVKFMVCFLMFELKRKHVNFFWPIPFGTVRLKKRCNQKMYYFGINFNVH